MNVEIVVRDHELASAIERGVRAAMSAFADPPRYPVVRLRTFRRLGGVDVTGKIAVVRVTAPGLRRLPALVEAIRAKGALGVQLVWDGTTPSRAAAEATVFAVLEQARATKSGPPVVLAAEAAPAVALRVLVAGRQR